VRLPEAHTYIALNKPAGYACTRRDPHLPRTVYELLPEGFGRLVTVGRLDVDTEGLLLLTDDGAWANGIAHPRRHVAKAYVAAVEGRVGPDDLAALRRGIPLEDGPTLPARARLRRYRPSEDTSVVELTITEGRKRQVRRMLAALGLRVLGLRREAIGELRLGDLEPGTWRRLTEAEVDSLRVEARQA
jgi:pseudouridine synthase